MKTRSVAEIQEQLEELHSRAEDMADEAESVRAAIEEAQAELEESVGDGDLELDDAVEPVNHMGEIEAELQDLHGASLDIAEAYGIHLAGSSQRNPNQLKLFSEERECSEGTRKAKCAA